MARGGGGGGGRGGGGSSGGNRGGGGRIGGSSSRGRGGSSWGGGSNRNTGGGWNSRPVIRTGPIFTGGPYRRRNYGWGPGGGAGAGCGCTSIIVALIVFGIIIWIFSMLAGGGGNNNTVGFSNNSIQTSTVEREPLPSGAVNETDYYTDEAGWISNETQMTNGLRHFYQETGVQPYVYITENIPGLSSSNVTINALETYANELYDELFTDEAHLLLLFYEPVPSDYNTYITVGTQAKQVVDNEAVNIILDYIDRNYYDSSLGEEAFFSNSFRDAADRMMEVTTSPWIPVFMGLIVVAVVAILFFWWRRKKQQDEIEAKRTEDILNRPIDTFGTNASTEVDDLAKKYQDEDDSNN
ncbi:TPM domain-containing protein [Fundicoccus culcitae]|uniref:TPM domain-containing protein n=1 Tax=Fundicoccus culcitae TaxID=2969821 RepID=A0ABY5P4W6_9LACT|nr:TPM domain-containing protein [Fundicoccus culcitae]UUX33616.1 TPM domain-containing protein [Fundicoccus culcitae]